jgi:16S rRNA (cytosine967-C5)-methyltransferase
MSDSAGALAPLQLAPPLWRQLQACATALQAVLRGRNHAQALSQVAPALRPAAQALLFAVLRRWGLSQAVRDLLVKREPSEPVNALLSTGIALLLMGKEAMYPAHTLVSQLVEAAKHDAQTRAQAAFINACMRRLLREQAALLSQAMQTLTAQWNFPAWWIKQVQHDYPHEWQSVLTASQQAAPMVLRVNRRQTSRDALQQRWAAQGELSDPVGEHGLLLRQAKAVQAIDGFAQGLCSVQDAAAQLAAPLLLQGLASRAKQRLKVLDACAAPGGKTAHLLEYADVEVWALEIDAQRCERINENLKRVGLQAHVLCADVTDTGAWWQGELFDAILLDAPCTASGIVRRHPDIPLLRRESDVTALVQTQRRLLEALWPLLAQGGRLLYCTCSVFHAEGQSQIDSFLARNTEAVLLTSPGHLVPGIATNPAGLLDNAQGGHDGFFYALLEKQHVGG